MEKAKQTKEDKSHPKRPIRRFDVFAEYSRLEGLKDGMEQDEAKGYGIWLAKVVAARKFGRKKAGEEGEGGKRGKREEPRREGKWRLLGDEPQTDALFEKEIIDRMGESFYEDVFQPAIHEAHQAGQKYTDIRDTLRSDWKPTKET